MKGYKMNYRVTKSISKEEKTIIFEHLLAYNLNHIEDKNPKELGIFADEENGRRMGRAAWLHTWELAAG